MDRQKFRIKRTNVNYMNPGPPGFSGFSNPSFPCSGGTNFFPINFSTNCLGLPMYATPASEILDSLSGNMTTYPFELRGCSPIDPCVILWDVNTAANPTYCQDENSYPYAIFTGLQLTSGGTPTLGTYDQLMTVFPINNADPTQALYTQVNAFFSPVYQYCLCNDPFADATLNELTIFLSQDFNDIGHYSVWDGNIDQQDIFSNFVFTADTTDPYQIIIYNTTDFNFYKGLKTTPYTIDWGDGTVPTPMSPINLSASHTYPISPMSRRITITQQTPWGPLTMSQIITVPSYNYQGLVILTGMAPQQFGAPAISVSGPGGAASTAYHGVYGIPGTNSYMPLDSGVNINQYSGMAPTVCFEITGLTQSSVGLFQSYSTAASSSAFLPPGYDLFVTIPLGGDVLDPTTNIMQSGMMGEITEANASYTAYTISSANGNTPIDFFDFANGITVFIALSCGLDANAFGGQDCYQCEIDPCDWCEHVDEYFNPLTQTVELISFNTNQGIWNSYTDYQEGDVVFDTTNNICCCFMAVKDQIQTAGVGNSLWAYVSPGMTYQGVWYSAGTAQEYLWNACSVDCNPCPAGTSTPCNDPSNPFNTGPYNNGSTYTIGDFAEGPDGNCYAALNSGVLVPPTGGTSQQDWDYVGCVSWICPPDVTNVGPWICEMISGQTQMVTNSNGTSFLATGYPAYMMCEDAWYNNECPTESRWVCVPDDPLNPNTTGTGQYGCGGLSLVDTAPQVPESGCVEVSSPTDPLWGQYYNNPLYPYAEVFSSFTDCALWCNPPAYSCVTPTQPPFCQEISCYATSNVTPGDYTTIMNYAVSTYVTPANIASNMQLWMQYSPTMYTIGDCQLDCGDLSGYSWDCEFGCQPGINAPYPDYLSCAAASNNPALALTLGNPNIGIFPSTGLAGEVPCGWKCEDPYALYNPMPLDPHGLGFYSSPCLPCDTIGCGSLTEGQCVLDPDCGITASCYVCDCTGYTDPSGVVILQPVICDLYSPCPTPSASNPLLMGPNASLGTYPSTPAGLAACSAACACDGGYDCAIGWDYNTNTATGTQQQPCTYYANIAQLIGLGLAWSPGGPYPDLTGCCQQTDCCRVKCDDDIPGNATAPNNPTPATYPCYYSSLGAAAGPCFGAINGVWCGMSDCLADNPSSGSCATHDCYCACQGYLPNTLVDRGVYDNTGTNNYDMYDLVTHTDPDSPECCYVCLCINGSSPYDCNDFTPDDGPSTNPPYQPNCWVSCGSQAWTDPTGCPPCIGSTGATYECTPDGCVSSACVYPGLALQTIQNCYSAATCEQECRADCFCDYTTSPSISSCVQSQQVILGNDPAGVSYPVFPMVDLNDCNLALSSGMDCCTGTTGDPTWHCDDSCYCDDGNGVPCGVGCVVVIDGVPNPYTSYPGAFTSLTDCQDYCTWTCDPQGLQSCIFIANTPPSPTTYDSAIDCWMFGPTPGNFQDCQCPPTGQIGWFCDTAGAANSTVGNTAGSSVCVPDSFLIGGSFSFAYLSQAYGPGTPSFATSFQGGSVGFVDQATCESLCRWCCNPTGTTFCELSWGQPTCPISNLSSEVSVYDCITTTMGAGNYPCSNTQYEWCCDPIAGCMSYVGTMPMGCVSGPYADLTGCTDECTFSCGDCANDCDCMFIGTPLSTTQCSVYSSMSECQQYLTTNPYFNAAGGCCDCYECASYGSISFWYWDLTLSTPTWVIGSVTATVSSTNPAALWVSGQIYTTGDVVIAPALDGSGNLCCYTFVYDSTVTPIGYNTAIAPEQYYTLYNALYLANDGLGANNALIWIPCDVVCAGAGPPITYSCSTGPSWYVSNDTCANKTIVPVGSLLNFHPFAEWVNTNLGASHYFNICKYSTNCSGTWNAGYTHCTDPALQGNCFNSANTARIRSFGSPTSGNMQLYQQQFYNTPTLWNYQDIVDWLNDVAATEGYAGGFTSAMSLADMQTLATAQNTYTNQDYFNAGGNYNQNNQTASVIIGGGGGSLCKCYTAATSANGCAACPPSVTCAYTSMTDCELYCDRYECIPQIGGPGCDCVPQPGGAFTNLHACQTTILNPVNCCYTGSTGYFKCVPNMVGGCDCIPTTSSAGYPSLHSCQTDTTACCWTGTTAGLCIDCQGQQWGYGQQNLDGIYNVFNFQNSSVVPTFDNTATAVGYASPQPWAPNALWGGGQIVIGADKCCYIYMGDSNGFPYGYLNIDPSTCYYNWLQGFACDGSSSAVPTQTWVDQNGYPIWIPCDQTCQIPPSYDCDPITLTCSDPGTGLGQYSSINSYVNPYQDCLDNCLPSPILDCKDCGNILAPTYFPTSFTPITFHQLPAVGQPALNLGLGDCIYNDNVGASRTECCWCCVCPHGWLPNIFNGNPECLAPPPIAGAKLSDPEGQPLSKGGHNSSVTPSPCGVKVIINQFNFEETILMGSAFYGTDWMSCGVQSDGSPCKDDDSLSYAAVASHSDCLMCCKDHGGYIMQLALELSPCECPPNTIETPCW